MQRIKDLPNETIIETIVFGNPTGNIYKLDSHCLNNKRKVWKRFRQGSIYIHEMTECRVVDPNTDIELNF